MGILYYNLSLTAVVLHQSDSWWRVRTRHALLDTLQGTIPPSHYHSSYQECRLDRCCPRHHLPRSLHPCSFLWRKPIRMEQRCSHRLLRRIRCPRNSLHAKSNHPTEIHSRRETSVPSTLLPQKRHGSSLCRHWSRNLRDVLRNLLCSLILPIYTRRYRYHGCSQTSPSHCPGSLFHSGYRCRPVHDRNLRTIVHLWRSLYHHRLQSSPHSHPHYKRVQRLRLPRPNRHRHRLLRANGLRSCTSNLT